MKEKPLLIPAVYFEKIMGSLPQSDVGNTPRLLCKYHRVHLYEAKQYHAACFQN